MMVATSHTTPHDTTPHDTTPPTPAHHPTQPLPTTSALPLQWRSRGGAGREESVHARPATCKKKVTWAGIVQGGESDIAGVAGVDQSLAEGVRPSKAEWAPKGSARACSPDHNPTAPNLDKQPTLMGGHHPK